MPGGRRNPGIWEFREQTHLFTKQTHLFTNTKKKEPQAAPLRAAKRMADLERNFIRLVDAQLQAERSVTLANLHGKRHPHAYESRDVAAGRQSERWGFSPAKSVRANLLKFDSPEAVLARTAMAAAAAAALAAAAVAQDRLQEVACWLDWRPATPPRPPPPPVVLEPTLSWSRWSMTAGLEQRPVCTQPDDNFGLGREQRLSIKPRAAALHLPIIKTPRGLRGKECPIKANVEKLRVARSASTLGREIGGYVALMALARQAHQSQARARPDVVASAEAVAFAGVTVEVEAGGQEADPIFLGPT